ncbi:MAG: hypothetical protein QXE96_07175 [Candidatus Caldarchaeum sp.]|jgi:hypothetical protein
MPRKSLSQRIVEALELAEQLRKVSEKLPPDIRQTIIQYSQISQTKRRRRSRKRGKISGRKRKTEPASA